MLASGYGNRCRDSRSVARVASWCQVAAKRGRLSTAWFESSSVDLVGQLSNPSEPLVRLLSILSRPTSRSKRRSTKPRRPAVDGRRRWGLVGQAVVTVLARADASLSAHDIRLEVEKLLGTPVSRHSIAYVLKRGSRRSGPAIIQTNHRYYRLISRSSRLAPAAFPMR